MFREALHLLTMRNAPDLGADQRAEMLPGEIGRQVDISDDGLFAEVVVLSNFLQPRQGWILLHHEDVGDLTIEVEAPPRADFSVWSFLKACIDTETWINSLNPNARFFVLADYLVALASIETKIKNAKNKNPLTDGIGPYQIASDAWASFTESDAGSSYEEADREEPLTQIKGAAFLALNSMDAISKAIATHDQANGDDETSGDTGPYIPSYVDVLMGHMLGNEAAAALRIAKMKGQGGESIEVVLSNHFNETDLTKLLTYRAAVMKDSATQNIETIDGFLINLGALLNDELLKSYKLMKEHIPEDLPKNDGVAPWYSEAESEHLDWKDNLVDEHTAPGTQRVLEYFAKINFATTTVQPWCGAFAGHCMLTSPPPFNAMLVSGPARAANWKSWGNTAIPLGSDEVPVGAVVVLAPEKGSSRSGHVGFFSRFLGADKKLVEIKGGNQSDTVTNTKFSRSKIAAIRWYSPKEDKESQAADQIIGSSPPGQFSRLLDFIGQHESHNNYNAFFGNSGNTNNPNFTAMTIADVVRWQKNFVNAGSKSSAVGKYQFLRNTLLDLVSGGHASRGDTFSDAIQDKLAIALLNRRKLGRFLSGSISTEEFAIHLAKEWASLPVPRDVKRGNRTVKAGQSYYAGDGLNKALVSVPAFLAAIETARG
ncbi:MAG: hypothetical protein K5905_04620 [Roseibium sp.]|uniref:hypothetical protein n=1 Tax=Roseibium sp. TaxID=1936156 RepID=UPI00261D4369|nr:hypothetical protein [Roseibium sp.]MCV0424731.1 hypothetical protein [Roseibium sp.]